MWGVHRLASASVVLALVAVGCGYFSMAGTSRPSRLADWDACWMPGYAFVPASAEERRERGENATEITAGHEGKGMLILHATWAKSAFRTENWQGEMEVPLTTPLQVGCAQRIEESSGGSYSEVTLGTGSESRLRGTVSAIEVEEDRVKLDVDLVAVRTGEKLKDTVEATVRPDLHACFFP
jgi:hypothetical protein